jgi:hypothetical protein
MASQTDSRKPSIRATVDLPPDLARRAERFVGDGGAEALGALIIAALEHFVVHLEAQAAGQPELADESLAWTLLSQDAFAEDWNSEEDAIYDDWERHYGLRQG